MLLFSLRITCLAAECWGSWTLVCSLTRGGTARRVHRWPKTSWASPASCRYRVLVSTIPMALRTLCPSKLCLASWVPLKLLLLVLVNVTKDLPSVLEQLLSCLPAQFVLLPSLIPPPLHRLPVVFGQTQPHGFAHIHIWLASLAASFSPLGAQEDPANKIPYLRLPHPFVLQQILS